MLLRGRLRRPASGVWPNPAGLPSDLPVTSPSFNPFPDRQALVVDDNAAICGLLKMMIERHKYRVLTFGDPHAALNYLAANTARVDFAVVDIGLGVMDGLEFAKRLRPLQPATVVVFSTGRRLTPEQEDYAARDRALFLPKPFPFDQLGKVIKEVESRLAPRNGSRAPV